MGRQVHEFMTSKPVTLPLDAPLTEAARLMRDEEVGGVLVTQNGVLCGLLTDRDIVVRAVAEGRDLTATRLAEVCSAGLVTVGPGDDAEAALKLMLDRSVRRLPVVEEGRPVGIVTVGDLNSGRDVPTAPARGSGALPPPGRREHRLR